MTATKDVAWIFTSPPELDGLELASSPLEYWKEVIYEGDFAKKWPDGHVQEFSVDRPLIDHWVTTTRDMLFAGIDIPVPIDHRTDPEARRASIKGAKAHVDSKGRYGFFQLFKFIDENAVKLAETTNVSLYSPPSWMDGKKRTWKRPIKHTALTDYPVIPDLDGWETITASFIEVHNMPLRELAKKLKIDAITDEAIESEIIASFAHLQEQIDELKRPPEQTISAAHVDMLRDNRVAKLERLASTGKITPATRDALRTQYCVGRQLELCLSQANYDDGFNALIDNLDKNQSTLHGEKSGQQTLELGDPNRRVTGSNSLVANAKKRADNRLAAH